ncbi:MAG: ABC transporter ATP-binding protein [Actinomycetota bacterium]|nr:ABC transporter ATP-binding protein [Actinomycetota bacterium]
MARTIVDTATTATARDQPRSPSPPQSRSAAPSVALDSVSKKFGSGKTAVHALDQVTLDVAPGEFVCLIGASGCGKSTLLNLVAGLDRPSAGIVNVSGRTALMFQESALFPWLTVARNVELALKLQGTSKAERKDRVADLLRVVHLDGFADKRPHELSGGMRQRVALARAFAQDADIVLMDEPFGALDAMTRDLLHDELERLWEERRFSVLFVTHNVREAARLADRVVLLSSRPGRVASTFIPDMPRPRRMEDPALTHLAGEITASLRQEVARHA